MRQQAGAVRVPATVCLLPAPCIPVHPQCFNQKSQATVMQIEDINKTLLVPMKPRRDNPETLIRGALRLAEMQRRQMDDKRFTDAYGAQGLR